ncbi:MAG: type VI secretion system-associated FHA domain protein TagH [Roseiarcus sp.]
MGLDMTLRLSIENFDHLPDGGPLRIQVRGRGLDIGRDAHLDWTLPDPQRHVSGKHCEVRFRDGGYWLHDVSTNGTYVNDSEFRLAAPYRLKDGDRLTIGPYIVAVEVKGAAGGSPAPPAPPPRPSEDAWLSAPPPPAPAPEREATVTPTPRRPAAAQGRGGPAPAPAEAPKPAAPPPLQPASAVAPASQQGQDAAELVARLAAAAGIPERALVGRSPHEVVDEIGAALKLSVENLALLLGARAESKGLMRSSSRTLIGARENNPLKFTATSEEAMAIMFGPRSRAYLSARDTIAESFADIKSHEVSMLLATKAALEALFEEFAPANIDKSVEDDRGLSALVASRKTRLWDAYVERWRTRTRHAGGRLDEVFAELFARAYDRLQNK